MTKEDWMKINIYLLVGDNLSPWQPNLIEGKKRAKIGVHNVNCPIQALLIIQLVNKRR